MESPPSRPRSGGGGSKSEPDVPCHSLRRGKKRTKAPKIGDVLPLVDGNVWASVISRLDRPNRLQRGRPGSLPSSNTANQIVGDEQGG